VSPRLRFFTLLCAALLTRHNQALVDFLLTENAILRELARPKLRKLSLAHNRAGACRGARC